MTKYINEETLRKLMYEEAFEKESDMQKWDSGCWIRYKLFENCLEAVPAEDVTEIKHGQWVDKWMCSNMTGYEYACRCSECNEPTYRISTLEPMPPYCPNCGTKMDGSDKNA